MNKNKFIEEIDLNFEIERLRDFYYDWKKEKKKLGNISLKEYIKEYKLKAMKKI